MHKLEIAQEENNAFQAKSVRPSVQNRENVEVEDHHFDQTKTEPVEGENHGYWYGIGIGIGYGIGIFISYCIIWPLKILYNCIIWSVLTIFDLLIRILQFLFYSHFYLNESY